MSSASWTPDGVDRRNRRRHQRRGAAGDEQSPRNEVVRWWDGRPVALSGHALIETYSVLTRLPGDTRLAAADAATLLAERFDAPLVLASADAARLPELLVAKGIAGGAVYDAVIAMAALGNGRVLATRDARAAGTYQSIGTTIEVVV